MARHSQSHSFLHLSWWFHFLTLDCKQLRSSLMSILSGNLLGSYGNRSRVSILGLVAGREVCKAFWRKWHLQEEHAIDYLSIRDQDEGGRRSLELKRCDKIWDLEINSIGLETAEHHSTLISKPSTCHFLILSCLLTCLLSCSSLPICSRRAGAPSADSSVPDPQDC